MQALRCDAVQRLRSPLPLGRRKGAVGLLLAPCLRGWLDPMWLEERSKRALPTLGVLPRFYFPVIFSVFFFFSPPLTFVSPFDCLFSGKACKRGARSTLLGPPRSAAAARAAAAAWHGALAAARWRQQQQRRQCARVFSKSVQEICASVLAAEAAAALLPGCLGHALVPWAVGKSCGT